MATQWFYEKGGTRHGPVTAQQLKELAGSGALSPTDRVWRDGMPDWKPAAKIQGLFPNAQPVAGPPPLPENAAALPGAGLGAKLTALAGKASDYARSDEAKAAAEAARVRIEAGVKSAIANRVHEQPLVIAAALVLFFPLGLFLVWRHPAWPRDLKWGWTALCLGMLGLLVVARGGGGPTATAPAGFTRGVGRRGGSQSEGMTRAVFTAKVDALGNPCKREELYAAVGKPLRTQTIDGTTAGL